MHPGNEFFHREWLGQIVIAACHQPGDPLWKRIKRSQEQHRQADPGGAQSLHQIDRIATWNIAVQHRDVVVGDVEFERSVVKVCALVGRVARRPQKTDDGPTQIRIIFKYQDPHGPRGYCTNSSVDSHPLAATVSVVFVKICGITSEEDALLAVAMGADALGFVFAPSTRQMTISKTYDICRRLPPEVLTVGVFRDESPARVIDTVFRAGLKAAQLHGRETPEQVLEVTQAVRRVIKAFSAASPAAQMADRYNTDLILVDSSSPGSGNLFDWSLMDNVAAGPKVILAGGLTPENVGLAIAKVVPWGVDVSTGVEKSPGKKDAVKVRQFIKEARAAAPRAYIGADELPYDWQDE
jgi:phosphoribosylanthranilate isomerase